MQPLSDRDKRFIEYLEQLASHEDRQALAILRRGVVGRTPAPSAIEAYRYVGPWLREGATPLEEEPYFMVANLFAYHPMSWRHEAEERTDASNLGASFALLLEEHRSRTGRDAPNIEARFAALLGCHRDDLWIHLRHAVGLLRSKDIPVDWLQLLQDVKRWDRDTREVQRSWARAFWRRVPSSLETAESKPEAKEDSSESAEPDLE